MNHDLKRQAFARLMIGMVCACAAVPAQAAAQVAVDPDTLATYRREYARSQMARPIQPAPLVRTPSSSAVFTASNDGSTVEVQGAIDVGFSSVVASISSPVGGSDTWLADLEGLRSGSTLGLALSGLKLMSGRAPSQAQMTAFCNRAVARGDTLQTVNCSGRFDLKNLGPTSRDSLFRMAFLNQRPTLYSLEIKGGPESHDFLDPATLEAGSERRWNASGNAGAAMFTSLGLVSLNVSYTGSWDDAGKVTRCTPVGSGAISRCVTLPLDRPSVTYRTVVRAGLKRFLTPKMGVNPRASYRTADRVWSAELPVYFIPSSDGSLLGGAIAAWRSDERRIAIGAFVGKALGLTL